MITLDLKGAAAFLQVHAQTLRKNVEKWGIPHAKDGDKYFFSEESMLCCFNSPRDTPEQIEIARQYAELLFPIVVPKPASIDPRRKFKMRIWKQMVATPYWVDRVELRRIYRLAAEMTAREGIVYHVDHIVPIMGENVCGLHVPHNLRIIPAGENASKGNKLIEELL